MYECKILADSISVQKHRLTTFQVTFPRFILAEVNTHRMLSRNSASSRAIPSEKIIQQIQADPFVPQFNQRTKGMGVGDPLDEREQNAMEDWWLAARDHAIDAANAMLHLDKSRVNRLLEPFNWHTAIISGTDWSNFAALRTAKEAQPEFRTIALMMQEAYASHKPKLLASSQWHLPLVLNEEIDDEALQWPEPFTDWAMWRKISVARCARVSYLTHDGKRDLDADLTLYDRLLTSRHLSPFEHVARPFTLSEWDLIHATQDFMETQTAYEDKDTPTIARMVRQLEYYGNYRGWSSARLEVPNEHDAGILTPAGALITESNF